MSLFIQSSESPGTLSLQIVYISHCSGVIHPDKDCNAPLVSDKAFYSMEGLCATFSLLETRGHLYVSPRMMLPVLELRHHQRRFLYGNGPAVPCR